MQRLLMCCINIDVVLKLNINKNTFVMINRFLVIALSTFVFTSSVCATSTMITKDKKPAKASSVEVKEDRNTKKEVTEDKNIFIKKDMLHIKTPLTNDLIYVYTPSGLCIDKFVKDTELIVKDASAYPEGKLIVTNGKDLNVKVIK